jgi:hypothetical protein
LTVEEYARRSFLAAVDRMEQWLNERRIPHALIGSLAVSAYVDEGRAADFDRPHAYNPTQRMPDIDLLVPRSKLDTVRRYADRVQRSDFPVNIDTGAAGGYIDFRPAAEHSYLTHRRLMLPVRSQLFEPRRAVLLGQEITTIDPRVLLHTFGTIGGVVRQKDVPKIVGLAEAIGSGKAPSRFTERDCEVFSRYLVARKRQYPTFIALKGTWEGVMDVLPPKAEGVVKHHLTPAAHHLMGRLNRAGGQAHRGLGR